MTGTLQRYRRLRLQMPLLELTDVTTSDLMEPFPAKAAQWQQASRAAFVAGLLALAGALAVAGWSVREFATASLQLKGPHPIKTQAALQRVARTQEALQRRGVPEALKKGRFLTAAEPALKRSPKWQLHVGPGQTVTLRFALAPEQDCSDVLTSLDKGLSGMGWQRQTHEDLGTQEHNIVYAPQP